MTNKYFWPVALALIALPLGTAYAATDYFLKIDGVEGESVKTEMEVKATIVATGTAPSANTGVEPDEIDNKMTDDDESAKKGKVEATWKVEEGEKLTTDADLSILLNSEEGDDKAVNEAGHKAAAQILLQGLQESDAVPTESLSLNFGEIKVVVKPQVKLFGLIPVKAKTEVEINAESQIKVKFPWWAFLASGKDGDNLGRQVAEVLAQVLADKKVMVESAINASVEAALQGE